MCRSAVAEVAEEGARRRLRREIREGAVVSVGRASSTAVTKADERLDDGNDQLHGLLAAGDPHGEVRMAWHAKKVVRSIYETDRSPMPSGSSPRRTPLPLRRTKDGRTKFWSELKVEVLRVSAFTWTNGAAPTGFEPVSPP